MRKPVTFRATVMVSELHDHVMANHGELVKQV